MKKYIFYIIGIILAGTGMQSKAQDMAYYMIVGTYTHTGSKGIYVYKFNAQTGKAEFLNSSSSIKNPSYITIHKDNIYAVSETNGSVPGSVSAYHFDRKNGELKLLNSFPTGGDDPCYLETDSSGRFLVVANYSGGSITVFGLNRDGSLKPDKQLIQHEGGSINLERQGSPHVHQTVFSPDEKYVLAPDLGKDRVIIYRFDGNINHPLSRDTEIVCSPGSGPRHVIFHPHKNFAYLIHELSPVISVYQYEGKKFNKIQEVNGWPEDFSGKTDGAEILVSPDGKFLYTSHRAEQNSIGMFEIDPSTGMIANIGFQPAGGKGPRFFTIDPSGKWLLAAHQGSDSVVIFKRNPVTGELEESHTIKLPIPVCIQFAPMK